MPIRVEAPNGDVVEFPDGTDDNTINGVMSKNYAQTQPAQPAQDTVMGRSANGGVTVGLAGPDEPTPQAERPTSQTLGFMEGATRVASNIPQDPVSWAIDKLLPESQRLSTQNNKQHEALKAHFAEREKTQRPGVVGDIIGSTAMAIPAAAITRNPFLAGGIAGSLNSDADTTKGKLIDTGVGALAGGVGDIAIRGAGAAIAPRVRPVINRLLGEGVQLTPGQLLGGFAHRVEDAASSFPLIGDIIKSAQRRGIDSFNTAAANRVLTPLGERVPANIPPGHRTVAYIQQRVDDAYDQVIPQMRLEIDAPLRQDMASLRNLASNLDPPELARFNKLIAEQVGPRFNAQNGRMTGETFKEVEETLRREIQDFGTGNVGPQDRRYADAVREVQAILRDNATRHSPPGVAERLRGTNEAYANLVRIENAAASERGGIFSPDKLRSSTRQAEKGPSGRKRQSARGGALMQNLASDGSDVLPQTVPDSGTATRGFVGTGIGLAVASKAPIVAVNPLAAGAIGMGLLGYTRRGSQAFTAAMTRRPVWAQQVRNKLGQFGRKPAQVSAATSSIDTEHRKPKETY